MFIFVCVTVLATLCLYPWWQYRRARSVLSHLPSLPTLPVVNNLHQLMGDGVHILTRLKIVSKTMDCKRSPLVFWLGPIPILGVSDPTDVNAVTKTYLKTPLASGEWKHTYRRLGAPNVIRKEIQEVFNTQALNLAARLKTESGKEFDANHKYIAGIALETICRLKFGVPSTGLTKEEHQIIGRASELYIGRSINVPFFLSFLYGLTPVSRELARGDDVLRKLVEKMINKTNKENEPDLTHKVDPLTQSKVIEELTTTIGAGYQVLANAITMCLVVVGSQTNVQDKLYKEINEVLGESAGAITSQDLDQMRYCEAVVCETLRLYPFIPLYFLHANKELQLSKCLIPKDTTCWVNIWGAGRSRTVWGAEADCFRPERWWEDLEQRSLMAFYLDNLTGLGKEFSLAMLKTMLAQCVRDLVFKSNTRNLRFKMSTVLQPINGHLIRVQARDSSRN